MNIAPFSFSPSLLPTQRAGANSSSPPVAKNPDLDSDDPKDIIAEIAQGGSAGLVKYQEKVIAKKAREDVLNSLGLTDADLKNMAPQKKSAIEEAIAKAIKQAIKNSIQGDGKAKVASDDTANGKAPAVPSSKSLISSSTLSALFDFQ
jgi:hypothetical protein